MISKTYEELFCHRDVTARFIFTPHFDRKTAYKKERNI